ncbi:restriction endonuclease subunit S [Rhizobium esperanzae]|uniref:Type I restriction enzyme S subunit n=1 Tax=Rhizobium esperanzae TaxID=1967781 RepID=A0A7W6R9I8_9HYPH|nr:restriction endonuclease subunit S [Rhizobium esperanzae]MBB4239151.1 type I restriction enzyme S subunit [Rhizobium esperanzae]
MSTGPHADFQDTGTEWLGQVPNHWLLRRLGYFFQERREKVSDREFPALSVTKNGIVPQLETAAKTDDGDNRKGVMAGDFVINSRSDRKGSSGIAGQNGSVSLINIVLTPLAEIRPRFAHYLLRSAAFQEEFYRYGKGIVADLWSTNYSDMKAITLAVPPPLEQSAIAGFLDNETAKIDALVEEQKRLIELLKEKRQAVISRAVTKGLNPDARMRDSGIEWLGEVPEHWEVVPFRRILSKIEQGWSPLSEERFPDEGQWGVMKTSAVKRGNFDPAMIKAISGAIQPEPRYALRDGDLLMIRGNGSPELVGGAAYVASAPDRCMLPDLLYRLAYMPERADGKYLSYTLGSRALRHQIELAARGIDILKIAQPSIAELRVPLPPRQEQVDIVSVLDAKVDQLDALANEAHCAVDLLTERRAALISATVTGKIDMRGLVDTREAAE